MSTFLMPPGRQRGWTNAGVPAAGCLLYTYEAGTDTLKLTFTDAEKTAQHDNPIVLDAKGEALIYWDGNYKVDLRTPAGVQITGYPIDNFETPVMPATLSVSEGSGLLGFAYDSTYSTGTIGRWLTDLSKAVGSTFIGYSNSGNKISIEQALDGLYYGVYSVLNPKFAGGADPTGLTDSTAAFQACADYVAAHGGKFYVPKAPFAIDRVVFKDFVYNAHIEFDGAEISGIAAVPRNAVFDYVNCVDLSVLGKHSIISAGNANYDAAMCIRAQAGTSQSSTRINIYNVTVRNFKVAFWSGQYNLDYQCSEINYFGAQAFGCPICIYNGGINAGAQFNGCNLVSEANASFPGIGEKWLWMEGGFVTVSGGTVLTNPTALYGVLFNPAQSTAYGNPYGTLTVVGANVEMNSGLIFVVNSRGLPTPSSDGSSICFGGGCRGYSGAPAAADFIVVADASFAGLIDTRGNNWYSVLARTAYNISSVSSLVKIVTDKTSMGRNFKNWMGGVYGGILIHGEEAVVRAFGIGATYTAGVVNQVKFLANDTANEYARYGGNYNLGTGVFVVPASGFTRLTITANMIGNTVLANADLYVKKNGVSMAYGAWSGSSGVLSAVLHNLLAGDLITLEFIPYGSNSTFDASVCNSLTFTGSTK